MLPIWFGDRFVGRWEPRIDRDRATVEVLGVWWEEGFEHRRVEVFGDAMHDALSPTCASRAHRLEWPPHLATEQRLPLADLDSGRGRVDGGWPESGATVPETAGSEWCRRRRPLGDDARGPDSSTW